MHRDGFWMTDHTACVLHPSKEKYLKQDYYSTNLKVRQSLILSNGVESGQSWSDRFSVGHDDDPSGELVQRVVCSSLPCGQTWIITDKIEIVRI